MPEQCPLTITVGSYEADREGLLWDTGLPDECYRCLMRALKSANAKTEYFQPELGEDEDEEMIDRYLANGLRRVDDSSQRFGVQEHGIEDNGANDGPPLL
jgi:hypothetical protein